jgi:hypothetical protein
MPHMRLRAWLAGLIVHQLEQLLDVRQVQFSLAGPLIFPEGVELARGDLVARIAIGCRLRKRNRMRLATRARRLRRN